MEEIKVKSKENIHIVFWLIKDLCWSIEFKPLALIMIFPTVSLAFYIAYKTKEHTSDFIHNLSVCFWICANATWMIGEFFNYELRFYAAALFGIGISIILIYYLYTYLKKAK